MNNNTQELIDSLTNQCVYEHFVSNIEVIETHISWVLLTGEFAYKIKKPIKYSFVDFSTLEKRKFYCEEELRLNKRLAPSIYLEVVAISGSIEQPSFSKNDNVIEYAVKMIQFPQDCLLSHLSAQKKLHRQYIDNIANEIANFHLRYSIASHKLSLNFYLFEYL